MKWMVVCLILFFFSACEGKSNLNNNKIEKQSIPKVVVERERLEKEENITPEVKIKLKRDGKDNYSWEISGSDADQILKVNEKFRKKLAGEQSR